MNRAKHFKENSAIARLRDILRGWGPADPRNILKQDSWFSQCTILANRQRSDLTKLICHWMLHCYCFLMHIGGINGPNGPRTKGVRGRPLPSTRKVSTTIHSLLYRRDLAKAKLTVMHMTWGQFIDHDLSHLPMPPMVSLVYHHFVDTFLFCIEF